MTKNLQEFVGKNLFDIYDKEILNSILNSMEVYQDAQNASLEIGKKYNLNIMDYPKITDVIINAGIGRIKNDKQTRTKFMEDMAQIIGQKPVGIKAKKSVSNFGLHQGTINAIKSRLGIGSLKSKIKTYSFLEKLINVALPNYDGFFGYKLSSVTYNGDLHISITDYSLFHEIEYSTLKFGFGIIIKTNIRDREKALEFFRLIKIPFVV